MCQRVPKTDNLLVCLITKEELHMPLPADSKSEFSLRRTSKKLNLIRLLQEIYSWGLPKALLLPESPNK